MIQNHDDPAGGRTSTAFFSIVIDSVSFLLSSNLLIVHFSKLCVRVCVSMLFPNGWSGHLAVRREGPRKVKSALWVSRWLTHS